MKTMMPLLPYAGTYWKTGHTFHPLDEVVTELKLLQLRFTKLNTCIPLSDSVGLLAS